MDSLSNIIASSQQKNLGEPLVRLLVDGDIIAYRAAAAVDGRMYTVKGFKGNAWKYKAEVVEFCKDNHLSTDNIEISFFPEPVAHGLAIVKELMANITRKLKTRFPNTLCVVFLTRDGNYRKSINPQYKCGRVGARKPEHLSACKDYLDKNYGATSCYGLEADDLLTIKATELGVGNFVICSIDKDLKQMEGFHYNFVKDELEEITYAEGRKRLWVQVISGDSTDSIESPKGLGEGAGKKLFANVDFDSVEDATLREMASQCYATKMMKQGKNKVANLDCSDVECFVREVYDQVYLLRTSEEREEALKLMSQEE